MRSLLKALNKTIISWNISGKTDTHIQKLYSTRDILIVIPTPSGEVVWILVNTMKWTHLKENQYLVKTRFWVKCFFDISTGMSLPFNNSGKQGIRLQIILISGQK